MLGVSKSLKQRISNGIASNKLRPGAAVKQARILGAARAMMYEKGYDSFSLRSVAKASGYSPAGLYEHFENKAALCSTLADDAWNNLGKTLNRATRNIEDPIERLIVGCEAYVDYATNFREDFLLLFSLLPCPRESNEEPVPSGSGLAVFLRNVKAAAEANAINAKTEQEQISVVYGLWAAAHGIAHLHAVHLAEFEADFAEANRVVFTAVLSGYSS